MLQQKDADFKHFAEQTREQAAHGHKMMETAKKEAEKMVEATKKKATKMVETAKQEAAVLLQQKDTALKQIEKEAKQTQQALSRAVKKVEQALATTESQLTEAMKGVDEGIAVVMQDEVLKEAMQWDVSGLERRLADGVNLKDAVEDLKASFGQRSGPNLYDAGKTAGSVADKVTGAVGNAAESAAKWFSLVGGKKAKRSAKRKRPKGKVSKRKSPRKRR